MHYMCAGYLGPFCFRTNAMQRSRGESQLPIPRPPASNPLPSHPLLTFLLQFFYWLVVEVLRANRLVRDPEVRECLLC